MIRNFKTEPYIYEVKDVNKTIIKMNFFSEFKREDCVNNNMLKSILTTCSNKYKQRSEFKNKKRDLYIMDYYIDSSVYNNVIMHTVVLQIPKLGLIKEFNLDEVFKFVHDSLYDPFINNDSFDEESFNLIKENRIKDQIDYPHSIHEYTSDIFLDFADEKKQTYIHRDEWLKALEKANPKDLYNYYKRVILDNKNILTFMSLNKDDKDEIIKVFNKYFKNDIDEFELDINYSNYIEIPDNTKKEININYNQCVLSQAYTFKDFTDDDRLLLKTLYYFLYSKENDLIFKELRNKRNLIYYHRMSSDNNYAIMGIKVFFNKGDQDEIKNVISNVFDMIRDENNFNTYKANLIRALEYDYLSLSDNIYYEVNTQVDAILNPYYINVKTQVELTKNITYDQMMSLLDRMSLSKEMIMYSKDGE